MIDGWLNRFEDEDGDGIPDWVEAAALMGGAIGINLIGIGLVVVAALCG
jgi:hypothetical protein